MDPIFGYIIAGVALSGLVWFAPRLMAGCKQRHLGFEIASDKFFNAATPLVSDERTPDEVVEFISTLAAHINNPKLVRRLLFSIVLGTVKSHAEHPPSEIVAFNNAVSSMPEDLRKLFVHATASGLIANALSGWIAGELFLRLMVPIFNMHQQAAVAWAPEIAMWRGIQRA